MPRAQEPVFPWRVPQAVSLIITAQVCSGESPASTDERVLQISHKSAASVAILRGTFAERTRRGDALLKRFKSHVWVVFCRGGGRCVLLRIFHVEARHGDDSLVCFEVMSEGGESFSSRQRSVNTRALHIT